MLKPLTRREQAVLDLLANGLTSSEMAEVFSKVIGRPVKSGGQQSPSVQPPSEDFKAMFNFFNATGYGADTPALRALYPGLQTLEQLLRKNGWENAQPEPIPEKSGWG